MLYGETEKREKKIKWRKYLRIFKKYIKIGIKSTIFTKINKNINGILMKMR